MATTPILPADHKVRYLYGSRTITKLASDLRPGKALKWPPVRSMTAPCGRTAWAGDRGTAVASILAPREAAYVAL